MFLVDSIEYIILSSVAYLFRISYELVLSFVDGMKVSLEISY